MGTIKQFVCGYCVLLCGGAAIYSWANDKWTSFWLFTVFTAASIWAMFVKERS